MSDALASQSQDFRQKLLSMLGLSFVLIMVALDQTVIGTALPTIVSELKGFNLYAWAGTAYMLTSVIMVPVFGKLGDEHGRKPFVVSAILLFTLASVMCGFSQSMLELVLSRALQGIGGGMLVATSFASVPDLFPEPRERLRWQILFSTAFGLANAVGPSLGGYLTEYWGWRWVFFVNLPVGALSLWFVSRHLPKIRHKMGEPSNLDWVGVCLIALLLSSLQLLVEWLPGNKPPLFLILLGLVFASSLFALPVWEKRHKSPVLPIELIGERKIAPLFALSLMMGFCMYAVMYYAPLMFQGGFGLSPKDAGLLVTPLVVFITVGSIVNGRIVTRLKNPNVTLYAGFFLFLLSAASLTQTRASTPHYLVFIAMMLGGLGLGLLMPNLTLFVQIAAPRTKLGAATAMLQTTRMAGGMLGTALVGALVSNRYSLGVNDMLLSQNASIWGTYLEDPQILVNRAAESGFVKAAGPQASKLLLEARSILVDSVHASEWLVVAFMVLVFWVVSKVPPVSLHGRREREGVPDA